MCARLKNDIRSVVTRDAPVRVFGRHSRRVQKRYAESSDVVALYVRYRKQNYLKCKALKTLKKSVENPKKKVDNNCLTMFVV